MDFEKDERLNKAIDNIRKDYGERSIIRGTFANTEIDAIQGGVNDGDYLMMGGFKNEDISYTDKNNSSF